MKTSRIYAAISKGRNDFRVVRILPLGTIELIGDIRSFTTFEEADKVAQSVSNGQYGYEPGQYVSMR